MSVLLLGIGNILLGDEGVGIRVVEHIRDHDLAPGVECVDGGTGGFHLLEFFRTYDHVVMVDATMDRRPAGTVTRLTPRFARDFPPTLSAHDIGLKDLLDALYLLNDRPRVTLFTISIQDVGGIELGLSDDVGSAVPTAAQTVAEYVNEFI